MPLRNHAGNAVGSKVKSQTVGFNYKSIGMRVCYEWELYNRYKKDYQILGDHRYNYLVVSMYIPIHL